MFYKVIVCSLFEFLLGVFVVWCTFSADLGKFEEVLRIKRIKKFCWGALFRPAVYAGW